MQLIHSFIHSRVFNISINYTQELRQPIQASCTVFTDEYMPVYTSQYVYGKILNHIKHTKNKPSEKQTILFLRAYLLLEKMNG